MKNRIYRYIIVFAVIVISCLGLVIALIISKKKQKSHNCNDDNLKQSENKLIKNNEKEKIKLNPRHLEKKGKKRRFKK